MDQNRGLDIPPQIPEVQELIDGLEHGLETTVRFPNGVAMSLGQALAFEAKFCEPNVEPERRLDPERRVSFLVGLLEAAQALPQNAGE